MAGWDAELAEALKELGRDVSTAVFNPEECAEADASGLPVCRCERTATALPWPNGHFDGIILAKTESLDALQERVSWLAPYLSPQGFLLFAATNRSHFRQPESHGVPADVTFTSTQEAVRDAGLAVYNIWSDPEADFLLSQAGESGLVLQNGHTIDVTDPQEQQRLSAEYLVCAVHPGYNPLEHARVLFLDGHPGWAYEILGAIPPAHIQTSDVDIAVSTERQLCLLAWMKATSDPRERLDLFYNAQALFYHVVALAPTHPSTYRFHAEAWRAMGNEDMAARLLRSLLHVSPLEAVSAQLASCQPDATPQPPDDHAPAWSPSPKPPRILFVTHPRPHYGLDVLYDGMCELVGDEFVCDYPWKPTLHGRPPRELAHYPCGFDRKGNALDLPLLKAQLSRGEFDVILWGDIEKELAPEEARGIIEAAGNTPLFVIDQQDDPLDNLPVVLEYLGIGPGRVSGNFKREMLACGSYPVHTFPLPFAYADSRVPGAPKEQRTGGLFWAGHREFGLRRLYVERIEHVFGMRLDRKFSQSEYARALGDSLIGLNIFGFGFDTVRYWEVPAHGCMLLSERLPIRIPHNFRDGESAVFFDDLAELEEKLAHYLASPDEARLIAIAGYEHLTKYHTGSARARQMLGWIAQCMRDRPA